MTMRRRICIVTGSRAEYGIMRLLMEEIRRHPAFELQVVATGMHLSPSFGQTDKAIEADGFAIDARVEMLLSSDSRVGTVKSMGLGLIGFADTFTRLQPDIILVLGDRFEILAATQAAFILGIPIAHLMGGDVTEGAIDDAMRHAMTKMATLHFVSTKASGRRVHQLGEAMERVYVVGHPGLDQLRQLDLLPRPVLEERLGFTFREKNLLVTFHPATMEAEPPELQLAALLKALDMLGPHWGIIITKANADPGGATINAMLEDHVTRRDNTCLHASLGQHLYFSTMATVNAVAGNSSSGLLEAPSLRKATINIGSRQKGRVRASSVIDCGADTASISQAIQTAITLDTSRVQNPYGDGHSVPRIIDILATCPDFRPLMQKVFCDWEAP